jgi:hypothetical protein
MTSVTPPNIFIDRTTGWLRAGWRLELPADEYIRMAPHIFGFRDPCQEAGNRCAHVLATQQLTQSAVV